MKIRDAVATDLATIVNIYNSTIPERIATADLTPVSLESRQIWFQEHSPVHRPIWVVELNDSVVGWLSFQSFYGRPAYEQTAELSIYVAINYRGQGIGKTLLEKAIKKSQSLGINNLVAFIFAHNQPSLQLFSKYKFQQWGYLPKVAVLDNIERDLVIMGLRIGG